jgi:aminoglycoside phosphotransferase (APT) family kinase protein
VGRGRRQRNESLRHEPEPEGDEWEEYGGELMWVAGYTAGGAPFGFTVDEFRLANERDVAGAGWARAKYVLRDLLALSCGRDTRVEVGFVKWIGAGISRDVFAAEVALAPDPERRSGVYVVLLPRPDADADLDLRTRQELRLLARLRRTALPFRVPEGSGVLPEAGHLAFVRRFVSGFPLDLRAGRQPSVRPWKTIGQIAAAIHALPTAPFEDIVPGHATRRGHAEESLRVFAGLEAPEALDAHAWALAHMPPAEPSVLVHGDLLGQNILLGIDEPPAVIDWEYAVRGDPAYDLAVVTRGVKQPFQLPGGLDRLIESYRLHGGDEAVTCDHVRLHELCMFAGWYRAALAGVGTQPPADVLGRLRGMLARMQRSR